MAHRSRVWHPFTQHALEPPPPVVVSAAGAWLRTREGRLLDAISSWWVTTHGHCHPAIMAAIAGAASAGPDQVIFAGLTHGPAEALAEALLAFAPPGLSHVFYSDSGSTAVEVGLKMALGAQRDAGRGRVAVMAHGYHGDTVGGMSLGARGVFNDAYAPLLFGVDTLPFPDPGHEEACLAAFRALAARGDVAALLLEPLVLGAGGMRMYAPATLAALAGIARGAGILLVLDEVMTGWGRTGTRFACEQAGVAPDVLCTSKGLTGGSLPLAATLCTRPVFDAHWSTDRSRTLFHSSSYTANPLACAAALANLAVWRDEPVADRIATLAARQDRALARFAGDPRLTARRCGTIAAIDVAAGSAGGGEAGYLAAIGPRLRAHALARGVLLRPLGNTVYVMPPYCIEEDELALAYDAIATGIDDATARGGGAPC